MNYRSRLVQLESLVLIFLFFSFHKDFVLPPELTLQARKSAYYLGHEIRVVPQIKIRQQCKSSKDDGGWCRSPCFSFMCAQYQVSFLQVTLVQGDMASAVALEQRELPFMSDSPNGKGIWWTIPPPLSIHAYHFLQIPIFFFSSNLFLEFTINDLLRWKHTILQQRVYYEFNIKVRNVKNR